MKDKLNQFVDNLNGQFVEVSSSSAIYQCMDLAYAWVFCLGFPKATIQNQYAYQVFTNPKEITYQYFDLIPNTPTGIPEDGDLVVFKGGTAGHIVVAIGEGTTSKFKCFEQNSPLGTNAHIGEKTYTNCLGWLRPKIQESSPSQPNYFKVLLQEAGLDLNNEGQFRAFWEKAVKYDNDVKSLQEQVKSANEALSDRALEVSVLTEKNQKLSDAKSEAEELLNQERSKFSEADWRATKCEAQNQIIEGLVEKLEKELQNFKEINNIYAYSWWTRLFSLFRG